MADERFMEEALGQAREAYRCGEVPIGAALVIDGKLIAADHNRREELSDATAHAEILVLRRAGKLLSGWRLLASTIYVTVEPCPMCAGALVQARVARLNHRLEVSSGVLGERCAALMQDFFRARRD